MVSDEYLSISEGSRVGIVGQYSRLAGCGGSLHPLEDSLPVGLALDTQHHGAAPLFYDCACLLQQLTLHARQQSS